MSEAQFHDLPDGRRIAFRHQPPRVRGGATFVFLPGYMSDMAGSKAVALADWARTNGAGSLLLDYSGCGQSAGDFADGTLSRWRDEVAALATAHTAGPLVLVGSSMGGWLMLLAAAALAPRVSGLIGIAAAPDFTLWGTSEADRAVLAAGGTVYEDNPYGPDPTPTHPGFWADGQALRVLEGGPVGEPAMAFAGPVRLLHGQHDPDVPWELSLRLAASLGSDDVQVTLIKDGDHRLSREGDIACLLRIAGALLAQIQDPRPS